MIKGILLVFVLAFLFSQPALAGESPLDFTTIKGSGPEIYGTEGLGNLGWLIADGIRKYSVPLCVIVVLLGGIYFFILGTKDLNMKKTGSMLMVGALTFLVLAYTVPVLFKLFI